MQDVKCLLIMFIFRRLRITAGVRLLNPQYHTKPLFASYFVILLKLSVLHHVDLMIFLVSLSSQLVCLYPLNRPHSLSFLIESLFYYGNPFQLMSSNISVYIHAMCIRASNIVAQILSEFLPDFFGVILLLFLSIPSSMDLSASPIHCRFCFSLIFTLFPGIVKTLIPFSCQRALQFLSHHC